MNLEKIVLNIERVIISMTWLETRLEFDTDNILIDENSYENILIYDIS